MTNVSRTGEELGFSQSQKHQGKVLTEQREIADAVDANTARLKALRLARDAQEKADGLSLKASRARLFMARRTSASSKR